MVFSYSMSILTSFMNEESIDFQILPLVQMKEDGSPIDLAPIRKICAKGLNKCPPEDRVIAWGLLSGVLPEQAEEWAVFREKISKEYKGFMDEFQISDYDQKFIPNCTGITEFGLPHDNVMEIIHNDIIRTGHHIFCLPKVEDDIKYQKSAQSNQENNNENEINTNDDENNDFIPFRMHLRRLERILYIFAQVNRTLSYMQGFNEITSVLYYVCSLSLNFFYNSWDQLEVFVFFLLHRIITATELSELFTTQDHSSLIHNKLSKLMVILQKHAPLSYEVIKKMNIHPLHFSYRRLNLLFAQDQPIPNLLIIWDAIIAHFNELVKFEFYLIVGQVKIIEPLIDQYDYSQTMTALQKLNICNPEKLVEEANKLWLIDHDQMLDSNHDGKKNKKDINENHNVNFRQSFDHSVYQKNEKDNDQFISN